MRSVGTLCHDLRIVNGVEGAFVLEHDQCIASSLPPQYDINRLLRVGKTLLRMQQITGKSGIAGDLLAFHWQGASLLAWTAGEGALLGLLTTPDGARDAIEQSVANVLRELADLLPQRVIEQEAPTRPNHDKPRRFD